MHVNLRDSSQNHIRVGILFPFLTVRLRLFSGPSLVFWIRGTNQFKNIYCTSFEVKACFLPLNSRKARRPQYPLIQNPNAGSVFSKEMDWSRAVGSTTKAFFFIKRPQYIFAHWAGNRWTKNVAQLRMNNKNENHIFDLCWSGNETWF